MQYNEIDFRYERDAAGGRVRYDGFRLMFYTEGIEAAEAEIKALADERAADRVDGCIVLVEDRDPELVLVRCYRDDEEGR